MNSARAKEILSGYRPGGEDQTDPVFESALALVESDPELARWFRSQQAMDAVLRRKFTEIPIPLGLETRIRANRPRPRVGLVRWNAFSPISVAAAAVLLVGGTLAWLAPFRPATWVDYQASAIEKVTSPYVLNPESRDHDQVRRGLAGNGFPADYRVPKGLEQYPLEGGFEIRVRGHNLSAICFGSDEEHKPDVWLIVMKRMPLRGAPADAIPRFSMAGRNPIATWAEDDNYYILATEDDGPDLKTFF